MNKLFVAMLVLGAFVCFVATASVEAATISVGGVEKKKDFFDVQIVGIAETTKSKDVFGFQPVNIVSNSSIAYWKVRVFCEESSTNVSIGTSTSNGCGTAQNFVNEAGNNTFFVTLNNPMQRMVAFSFALKAYDVNGKWIHTVDKGFRWR